ncbi:DUF1120 domain-containing protein [Salmonella enterica]|uniref:Membrane protein n=2 Tax=Salmonella enterica TaxID=28901 RepID=A0A379QRC9_SALER|nr:DUF1120 domain-containing protein [Salmonella enterica]ECC1479487.1 DUF1120 domain-containing protein [Salmonella enterica subsp. salamae]ASG89710.1 hypothetical protein LFZ47_20275 [Salmonella enterica subsp. salamae serovar 55:k:z39 str. 1315K]ECC1657270.1 DUF1120 domain-containing protein [Salmonella enterica subsp. salamae]ECD9415608.1 DUF1120 domain-containing protein [Salmonella enterica subsp. salamae]ECF5932443.1 DUF1120 domain-containing protein [Salmonella enterica subsp. salamae]
MKKILLATAVAVAFSATGANAASTAVLKVTGLLSNAACTPQLAGGGVVDYGRIRLADLSPTGTNQLGTKNIDLTITCPSATKAAWTITDDRADTHPGAAVITINNADATNGAVSDTAMSYGVGKTAGGVKIGAFSIFTDISNVTADGVKVDAISGVVSNPTWVKSTTGIIKNGNVEMMSAAATGTTDPLAFTTATFPLKTSLAIQSTSVLAITDDTNLDGQATITIKYL